MSSIIYVSDNNMLEYHRLHGHKSMNFWRFENGKQFTKFIEGDLLFFLAKKSERSNSKEKGIIGYGRLSANYSKSVAKMWEDFGDLNGFSSKEELRETIKKLSKDNKVPRKMNCLFLDSVLFFNAPVYLSEFGFIISNHLESYLYVDEEGLENKILSKAQEIGVDTWASMMTNQKSADFTKQQTINSINTFHDEIKDLYYNEKDKKIVRKILEKYLDLNIDFHLIKGSSNVLIKYSNDEIFMAFINVASDIKSVSYQRLIGYMLLYKMRFVKLDIKIKFIIINNIKNESGNEVLKWINY